MLAPRRPCLCPWTQISSLCPGPVGPLPLALPGILLGCCCSCLWSGFLLGCARVFACSRRRAFWSFRRACLAQSSSDSWRSRTRTQPLLETPSRFVDPMSAPCLPRFRGPRSQSRSSLPKAAPNRRRVDPAQPARSHRPGSQKLSSSSSRHRSGSPVPCSWSQGACGRFQLGDRPPPPPPAPAPRAAAADPRASAAQPARRRSSGAAEAGRRSRDKRLWRTRRHAKRSMWRCDRASSDDDHNTSNSLLFLCAHALIATVLLSSMSEADELVVAPACRFALDALSWRNCAEPLRPLPSARWTCTRFRLVLLLTVTFVKAHAVLTSLLSTVLVESPRQQAPVRLADACLLRRASFGSYGSV